MSSWFFDVLSKHIPFTYGRWKKIALKKIVTDWRERTLDNRLKE